MLNFADNNLSTTFLTEDDIRKTCPMAFLTEPSNPKVSERYVQATSIDVVRDMAKLGWYPVQAKQCRMKKNSSGIRSFHMLSFQNPDFKIMKGDNVEAFPRIILTNSHDGFNSFKFMCGLYRLVCSNGLVVADAEFANLSIRHINYTFEELREVVKSSVSSISERVNVINDMMGVELTNEQREEFASKAMKIRKGLKEEDNYSLTKEEIMDILSPVRKEDEGNSLWATFNVLQEKLIKGGYYLTKNDKTRKQRGITSIKKDIEVNSGLFMLATSYMTA